MEAEPGRLQADARLESARADRNTRPAPSSRLALLILAFVVGAGFVCLAVSGPPSSLAEELYRSVGLLTHESAWVFDKDHGTTNTLYRLLAVIGPIATAATATYLLTDWLRPASIRLAAFLRVAVARQRCVALVGLSDKSVALAASLRTGHGPDGRTIVPIIFSDDTQGALIERCRRHGIATYPRHAHGPQTWFGRRRAKDGSLRVRKLNRAMNLANDLISFLPNATAQVDFLAELPGWSPRGGADCRAWILMEDRGLTQRLDSQLARFTGFKAMPRLLAISTLAARQLLMSQQFDTLADAFGQAQVHLAIYGMGELGRAIVKEAAQLYVTRPSLQAAKLRITFFDGDAHAAECALFAENPGLRNVINLSGHTVRIENAGLRESQVECLAADVTGHIVTFADGEAGFSLAVSLRHWLLEPPNRFDETWLHAHHAAPIFVRAPSWSGLGRLFYKPGPQPQSPPRPHQDNVPPLSPLPAGIVGFGAVEGLFGGPELRMQKYGCLLDTQSEAGAKALHAAYCRARTDVSVSLAPGIARAAETTWDKLSPQLRESNFRAFDHIAIKARAIGYRLVRRRKDEPATQSPDAGAFEILEKLEHLRFLAERTADGWRYAARRLDAVGVHPDLVDWAHLDLAERTLDAAQIDALRDIAAAADLRFARALVIGVVGHRPNRLPQDTAPIGAALRAELSRLQAQNSERAPLLLTALAPGADMLAAEAALALGIPFIALLPLPYELYREDFTAPGELDTFHRLAAAAELYIELPLRFGTASTMTTGRQEAAGASAPLRANQYALAGAYIVERAHALIAVSDGYGSRGTGGTADVLRWWNSTVPEPYATPSQFFVRPTARGAAIVIDTEGKLMAQRPLHEAGPPGHNERLPSRAV